MNAKLLTARPFLPETTLLLQRTGGGRGSLGALSLRSDRPLFGGVGGDGSWEASGLHSFGSFDRLEEMDEEGFSRDNEDHTPLGCW